VALGLFVAGLALTGIMTFLSRPVVVDEGTVTNGDDTLELGPHDPGLYQYSVWVEDYYPGFDRNSEFDVYATDEEHGDPHYTIFPNDYEARRFDGTLCELMHGWEPWSWAEDEVWFGVNWYDQRSPWGDDARVFVVRSGGNLMTLVLSIGIVLTFVGGQLLLMHWWEGRKARDHQ